MTSHLEQRFSEQIKSINDLIKTDDAFSELCANYENICNGLVVTTMKGCFMGKNIDLMKEMIQELEDES